MTANNSKKSSRIWYFGYTPLLGSFSKMLDLRILQLNPLSPDVLLMLSKKRHDYSKMAFFCLKDLWTTAKTFRDIITSQQNWYDQFITESYLISIKQMVFTSWHDTCPKLEKVARNYASAFSQNVIKELS